MSSAARHITTEELAAYLDGGLDSSSSTRLEQHMADCSECRSELVDARALLATAPPTASSVSPPRRKLWAAGLAAAAVLVLAALPVMRRVTAPDRAAPVLRAAPTSQAEIDVISPGNEPVNPATVLFIWRPVEGASTYRLTVTDSSGTPLFTRSTTDTTATAPSEAAIGRGRSYLWYVDALRNDGRTSSSGIRSFSTAR